MGTYSIGEAAERTGFPIETLRYYERAGLAGAVARDRNGRRRYTDDDLEWLGFIHRLKTTGMSLARIEALVRLCRDPAADPSNRRAVLTEHRQHVLAQLAELQRHLAAVDIKLGLRPPSDTTGLQADAPQHCQPSQRATDDRQ